MYTRNLLIAASAAVLGLSMAGAASATVDRPEPRVVERASHTDVGARAERTTHVLAERAHSSADRTHASADRASVDKTSLDKSSTDKASVDKSSVDKSSADKASADTSKDVGHSSTETADSSQGSTDTSVDPAQPAETNSGR